MPNTMDVRTQITTMPALRLPNASRPPPNISPRNTDSSYTPMAKQKPSSPSVRSAHPSVTSVSPSTSVATISKSASPMLTATTHQPSRQARANDAASGTSRRRPPRMSSDTTPPRAPKPVTQASRSKPPSSEMIKPMTWNTRVRPIRRMERMSVTTPRSPFLVLGAGTLIGGGGATGWDGAGSVTAGWGATDSDTAGWDGTTGLPHSGQNEAEGGISAPHVLQCMVLRSRSRREHSIIYTTCGMGCTSKPMGAT